MNTLTNQVRRVPSASARTWSRLSLPQRYALASLPVLIVGMLGLGSWVTRSIEEQVIQNTAINASLFVNSFVSPELQGLAHSDRLTDEETQALESLLINTPLGRRIRSVKVWLKGGRIGYYTRHQLIGRTFEPTESLKRAWAGEVTAELGSLGDEEDSAEQGLGIPLLEVYMPVRQRGGERVIAVAEFYKDATNLEGHLRATRLRTWFVVALITLAMYGILFGIVHAGGRLIRRQDRELRSQVGELSRLLAQNENLRSRVDRATRRVTEINEHHMRRLSADFHDGPAQALGLALLRLDNLGENSQHGGSTARNVELERVRDTLQEALAEIRQLCRGLTLPELRGLDMKETLERVVQSHQRRTNTEVDLSLEGLGNTSDAPMPIKITAYRVVQEALTNSFRHASGRGQRVEASQVESSLKLTISDTGDGLQDDSTESNSERLGLKGLRERVESLGGQFDVESAAGRGTTVTVWLPLVTGA